MTQTELLSVNEAAAILGRTPLTIRRQISEGKLRARKVGRQWRIDRAELDRPGGDRNISNDIPNGASGNISRDMLTLIIEQARHQSARLRELERQVEELRRDNDRLRARVERVKSFGAWGIGGILIEELTASTRQAIIRKN